MLGAELLRPAEEGIRRRVLRAIPLRSRVHALFEAEGLGEEMFAAEYQHAVWAIFGVTIVAILTSIVTFSVETLPEFYNRGRRSGHEGAADRKGGPRAGVQHPGH
eukprot:gene9200-20106_t